MALILGSAQRPAPSARSTSAGTSELAGALPAAALRSNNWFYMSVGREQGGWVRVPCRVGVGWVHVAAVTAVPPRASERAGTPPAPNSEISSVPRALFRSSWIGRERRWVGANGNAGRVGACAG